MSPISGYTDRLPDDVMLGTGVIYVGASPWGATRGGVTFRPNAEMRNIEFDGKKSPVKGLDRKTYQAPTIEGRFVQFGEEDFVRIEPGISGSGDPPQTFTPVDIGTLFADGAYMGNVRCVFERGQGGFVQIRFPVALCTRYEIGGQDRSEGEVTVTIEARLDPATQDMEEPPYLIEALTTIS